MARLAHLAAGGSARRVISADRHIVRVWDAASGANVTRHDDNNALNSKTLKPKTLDSGPLRLVVRLHAALYAAMHGTILYCL